VKKRGPTRRTLSHQFVQFIPEQLQEGVLYVSTVYATATHRCFCGCGREVVTPLSPTDWKLTFDGETVSLSPSIGNWSFPCRSHYWIEANEVQWSGEMSQKAIDAGRSRDRQLKAAYFGGERTPHDLKQAQVTTTPSRAGEDSASVVIAKDEPEGVVARLLAWLRAVI